MDKATFVALINAIEAQSARDMEISHHLCEVMSESFGVYSTRMIDDIIDTLDTLNNGNWVSWWMYDIPHDEARISVNGEEQLLDTPEKLYDFIAEENANAKK